MRLPRYCPNARYSQGPLAALRAALTFRVVKDPPDTLAAVSGSAPGRRGTRLTTPPGPDCAKASGVTPRYTSTRSSASIGRSLRFTTSSLARLSGTPSRYTCTWPGEKPRTDTVLNCPRPPKRRTCTPGAADRASASELTPAGAPRVSMTVAKPVTSAGAGCVSRAGGAVTTTSFKRCGGWSSARAPNATSATSAHDVSRRIVIPQPLPRGRCRRWSRRAGLLARGSPSPGAFPPRIRSSGGCRARPPSQLRGSGGFAPPSRTRRDRGRSTPGAAGRQGTPRNAPGSCRPAAGIPGSRPP